MKLQYLREFVMLAKYKNYNAVAGAMFISQPSISRHIKEMEDELGITLLTRSTRSVALTEYGMYFLPYASKIIAVEDEYLEGISRMQDINRRSVFIGIIPQFEEEITNIVSDFTEKHSEIRFSTSTGESEDLRAELIDGNLDFIFIRESPPYDNTRLAHIPVSSALLQVVLSSEHPLAGREQIDISELRKDLFLLSESTSLAYKLAIESANAAGYEPNVVFQGTRTQLLNLVRRNMGISLLFSNPTERQYSDVRTAILTPHVYTNINCVYVPENIKSQRQKDFLNFMMERSTV